MTGRFMSSTKHYHIINTHIKYGQQVILIRKKKINMDLGLFSFVVLDK